MKKCKICGKEIWDDVDDICDDCAASIIWNENIEPNVEDFL